MQTAVRLAERSAETGRAAEGLEGAIVASVRTAGGALAPTYGFFTGSEPVPSGEHARQIAAFVAKSAEWAAKAAGETPAGSAHAALEAYTWARDAAHTAEAVDTLPRAYDLTGLCRVAARGRWTDDTPVPPRVFELLAEGPSQTPWWAFWR